MRIGANRLLNTTAFIALTAALPTAAFAQTDAADASTGEAETIVVTGSRIARPQLEGASPVTVINNAEVKLQGRTRAEDLVNNLPQAFANQSSGVSNGSSGTATIDLRGLGPVRTLVLMNGRRLPPANAAAPVADINAIPAALIERVDVLTGGASATYGADAIAGVVNFVMDTDFEGFRVDAQYSFYQHNNDGDPRARAAVAARNFPLPTGNTVGGGQFDTTLTFGVGTDDGRGHVTAYAGYRKVKPVLQSEYDYSACNLGPVDEGVDELECAGSGTGAPAQIWIYRGPGLTNRIDANPAAPGTQNFVPTGAGFTGFRIFGAADQYNFGPTNYFQRPDERFTMGAFAEYEVSDFFKPYLELSFMDDRNVAQIAASGMFGVDVELSCDSPLLSDAQRAVACAPGQPTATFVVQRRNVEGGGRQADFGFTQFRLVAGMKGDLSENWSYDMYGQYGRTNYTQIYRNEFSISRSRLALDAIVDPATGQLVCRDETARGAGCSPYNPFRGTGIVADARNGVTQAALDYLQTPGFQRGYTTEQIVSAAVTGDLGTFSPWSDEGFGLALGAEYRKENLVSDVDTAFATGDLAGQGGPTPSVRGGYDVKEVFGEVRLPIATDMPFAQSLALEAGYRYSDYSQSAPGQPTNEFSTDTFRVGAEWAPIDAVRLRASFNRAVRAPNVVELYTPGAVGLWSGADPCVGATPAFTLAQCQRTGVTAAQYGTLNANPAAQYNGFFAGNPNLDPESADTWTAGVVLAPKGVLSGFTAAIDYFDIKVDDYIAAGILSKVYLQQCGLTGDARFCDRVNRDETGSLWLLPTGFVVDENINSGGLRTKGVDVALNYRMDLGEGGLGFNFVGTYLDELSVDVGIPDATGVSKYDCKGFFGLTCGTPAPEWRHTFRATYTAPSVWSASVNWRYVGSVTDEQQSDNSFLAGGNWTVNDKIKAQSYFDLALTADVSENASFRVGVNNVFDRDPPIIASESLSGTVGNGNTYTGTYDYLGRYVFVGASFNF